MACIPRIIRYGGPFVLILVTTCLWAQPFPPQNEFFTNRLVTKVVDYTIITAPPLAPQGACRTYVDGASLYMSCSGSAYIAFGIAGAGAPTNAQYWVGAADGTLSAEKNLGALSTGLVINTTGTPSAYAGTSCTNQFPRSLNASGAATCATVANTDLANSSITINGSSLSLGGSASVPIATTQFAVPMNIFGTLGANQMEAVANRLNCVRSLQLVGIAATKLGFYVVAGSAASTGGYAVYAWFN